MRHGEHQQSDHRIRDKHNTDTRHKCVAKFCKKFGDESVLHSLELKINKWNAVVGTGDEYQREKNPKRYRLRCKIHELEDTLADTGILENIQYERKYY